MEYTAFIIGSQNASDYFDNSADGIRYDNLSEQELGILIELSLKQDFSIIVSKNKYEE